MVAEGNSAPNVRVVDGTGTGPTAVASYDAALADANLHAYNLATLSSVVPPGSAVEAVGTAPPLGPAGGRLWTVQARTTTAGPGRAAGALGWAAGPDGGVLYEAGDAEDEAAAREQVVSGLDAARTLRNASLPDEHIVSTAFEVPAGTYGTAVVVAAFGEAEPIG
ncbi:MAG: pyruvoyl-dependent arginine decarboxylase [Halobacteriales archaeon]